MFKKATDIKPTVFSDCHGGKGDVIAHEMFNRGEIGSNFQFFQDTFVPVGSSIGLHRHVDNAEVYYMLQGEGDMYIDGECFKMRPGDISVVESGHTHKLINTGNTPIRIIVVEAGLAVEAENIKE